MIPRAFLFALAAAAMVVAQAVTAQQGDAPPLRGPDVIFVPTPQNVIENMLKVANVRKGDVLYDLGCGDGRIVVEAAKRYGVRAVGIDIDPQRIAEARERAREAGVEKLVEFRNADLFEADIREATVVTLYLLPSLNVKLMPKLRKELRKGTRVVSHDFDMGAWKADRQVQISGRTVYLWTIR